MKKTRKEVIAKLNQLAKGNKSQWLEDATWRKENRNWLKKSQAIALKILRQLRNNKQFGLFPCSQVELAISLGLTPQQVNKWVKGNENFTLETISKLENALNIDLINTAKPQSVLTGNSIIIPQVYLDKPNSNFELRSKKKKGKLLPLFKNDTWSPNKKYAY